MRAADGAGPGVFHDRLDLQRDVQTVQFPDNAFSSFDPFVAEKGKVIKKALAFVVDKIPQNVYFLILEICAEFNARNYFYAELFAKLDRIRNSGDAVVMLIMESPCAFVFFTSSYGEKAPSEQIVCI